MGPLWHLSLSFVPLLIVVLLPFAFSASKPDIIFILTDDQDLELGSLVAMPKLKALVADMGATYTNAYVNTPVCCPSRATIFTGLLQHNTGVVNNTQQGECFGREWRAHHENNTFNIALQNAGYRTSFAGKYLNEYYNATHVPPGWTDWFALLGNSVYYDYNMSVNGQLVSHGGNYSTDYFTDLVGNHSVAWLEESFRNYTDSPVFSMIATPACHDPQTPAPQYANLFPNMTAPRTPNFNYHSIGNESKHFIVNWEQSPMSNTSIYTIDTKYANRLRTLVSVDDIVGNVIDLLTKYKRLDNAYIVFFSDNGYHLGQFCITFDKRMPYETDIHIPMFARGPSINPASYVTDITLSIDLASTFVYIATGVVPEEMDGQPFIATTNNDTAPRRDFIIEYTGEYSSNCSGLWPGCCNITTNALLDNWCIDSGNNTYSCLRTLTSQSNTLYCEFQDALNFTEYYDLRLDPYEQYNSAWKSSSVIAPLASRLKYYKQCRGRVACNPR
jgi:N-acetylglucosamine-6-sulfatase